MNLQSVARTAINICLACLAIGIAVAMTGCTVVTAKYQDFEMTIVSLQPSGQSTEVEADINGVGTLTIGRNTNDSSEIITDTADALIGL